MRGIRAVLAVSDDYLDNVSFHDEFVMIKRFQQR